MEDLEKARREESLVSSGVSGKLRTMRERERERERERKREREREKVD